MTSIEIQFAGYDPETMTLPLSKSPFEHVHSADEANSIIESALMGDEDDAGWIRADANGEAFQVRRSN